MSMKTYKDISGLIFGGSIVLWLVGFPVIKLVNYADAGLYVTDYGISSMIELVLLDWWKFIGEFALPMIGICLLLRFLLWFNFRGYVHE